MEKMDMVFYRKLPTPKEVKEQYPVGTAVEKLKAERDRIIRNIFEGKEGIFYCTSAEDAEPRCF